jgi:predicted dehydrogenase
MQRRNLILTAASAAAVRGANERVRGAIIGSGGRGRLLTGEFKEIGVEMAAVCDVYKPNLEAGLKVASSGAAAYSDYRKLLEDKSLDVVVVATPDHWHAQMVIDAVHAGKDVYVEKPMAHTPEEGYRIIDAVRKTKRVVQVGTQRRSFPLFHEAKKLMAEGGIGDVRLVNGWWYNHQSSVRQGKFEGEIDWKAWLGTAPKRDADPARFFNWYYYWDYSGGLMIGQAAHIVDSIHWFMNSGIPSAVVVGGGRPNLAGVEVPETTTMCLEYPENYLTTFTVGYKAMRYSATLDQLVQYNGSKARFDVGRESYALYREDPKAIELKASAQKVEPGTFNSATRSHIRNLLECVKSRKDPNAAVEAGHATSVAMCMAMESLRRGVRARWNEGRKRIDG